MPRESNLERRFVKAVEKIGGKAVKIFNRRGWPDRVVVLPGGRSVWVELKAPGEKAKSHQSRVHKWLRKNGHTVILFDGTRWPQVFTWLRGCCKLVGR